MYEDYKIFPKGPGVVGLTCVILHCYRYVHKHACNHSICIVRLLVAARPFLSESAPVFHPNLMVLLRLPNRNAKWQSKEEGHRSPVSQRKVLRQRIEREVASRTFRIMVRARKACCRGSKATAGDHGRCLGGADGGS